MWPLTWFLLQCVTAGPPDGEVKPAEEEETVAMETTSSDAQAENGAEESEPLFFIDKKGDKEDSVEVNVNSLDSGRCWNRFNPLRAKFFGGNINIYLHFVSFLHIGTTQVVEILPQVRRQPTYSI